MNTENTVAQRMEMIQGIFREVQASYSVATDLDSYDIEFRSIAYEAASMCVALEDLKAGTSLTKWFDYLHRSGAAHATQIHVGLGWALAQNEVGITPILSQLDPMMRYRVLDGYGYYDGTFRRRKAILNQQKPEFTDPVAAAAYDQGLGRCMWYLNNGNIDATKAMLQKLPAERHADMWRGWGIATAYVGGCTEDMLHELLIASYPYRSQFITGAAMALISRHYSGHLLPATSWTSRVLSARSTEAIIDLNNDIRSSMDLQSAEAYPKWIAALEAYFS